jgi:hypothetical protein
VKGFADVITDPKNPPSRGPFICAALSTAFATGLLIALKIGLKLTMFTTLAVLIPGMTFATLAIAVSMGWAFVAMGRYKQQARWMLGTGILITITMLELLVLTYLADLAGKTQ